LLDWLYNPAPANEQEARGRKLLLEWLSEAQRKQYEERNCFEVTGCHSGKRYRIRHGMGTNVYELDDEGRPLTGWCFVPEGYLVAGDVVLAQKIALETDELGALRAANNFSVR
jgi:hypothetical protein